MSIASLAEASTIIPVRQGAAGLEVYLVRRGAKASFMAGNYVFPGGMVDPADRDVKLWAGVADLGPTALAERLGGDLGWREVLAYGVAALRETFEEAGVFLGTTGEGGELDRVLAQRRDGHLGREWLVEQTAARGWRLSFSSLSCWAWWITPEGMKRRFDTRFFLASFPSDQTCSPDGREVVEGVWTTPRAALVGNVTGDMPLSPPIVVTMHDFLRFPDAEALLSEARGRRWGEALAPRLLTFDGGAVLLEPWDPDHANPEAQVDPATLPDRLLPVGEPFSRLWSDGKLWRPVAAG